MTFEIRLGAVSDQSADAIVIGLNEGIEFNGLSLGLSNQMSRLITDHVRDYNFKAQAGDVLVVHRPEELSTKYVIVVGLGDSVSVTSTQVRQAVAAAVKKAKSLKVKSLATSIMGTEGSNSQCELAQAVAEGALLGSYQFDRYKSKTSESQPTILEKIIIAIETPDGIDDVEAGVKKGEAIASAVLNCRDIINEPPSHIKPSDIAGAATEIAGLSPNMNVKILDEAELQTEGYNALLAVAAGSDEKPYLIHLHYKPATAKKSIAFVGKGVTFDSGGLGLKPWRAMLTMKGDMAGGAAVLGIFQALAELEAIGQPVPVEVHGIIPTTENMISGKAMRPDDIIETKSGKTIEITHTDAEGRLILSDGLTYAVAQQPLMIIDFATLTGAAIRALGRDYAAFMGNNLPLLQVILDASDQTGELAWQLPLPKMYRKYIDSKVADIVNSSLNDYCPGAIEGGLFLQEFVDERPWAHIDIAGPAWQDAKDDAVNPPGGTGYGIRLGIKLLENLAESE